jgi:phosphatidylserine decarboxylase
MQYNLIQSVKILIEESYDILCVLYLLHLAGVQKEIIYFVIFLLIWFHRIIVFDDIDKNDQIIYAPTYGIVRYVHETDDKIVISTFLRPHDVHIQYMPYRGVVQRVIRNEKKDGYCYANDKCSDNNNSITTVFNTEIGDMYISQISGVLARKIIMYATVHEELDQGDQLGFIRFGSRVDFELHKKKNYRYKVNVKKGDFMKGLYTNMVYVLPTTLIERA